MSITKLNVPAHYANFRIYAYTMTDRLVPAHRGAVRPSVRQDSVVYIGAQMLPHYKPTNI